VALTKIVNGETVEMSEAEEKQFLAEQNLPPTESQVRAKRRKLLEESDWTQVVDAPVDQAAWATYRQELRDVPQQSGFPENVVWPTEPG
jgi:hypothetical protein